MPNQPDIVMVDKQRKKAVAIPNDSNIRKKDLKKCQWLGEELENMWKLKTTVVPMITGALRGVTPKLGK